MRKYVSGREPECQVPEWPLARMQLPEKTLARMRHVPEKSLARKRHVPEKTQLNDKLKSISDTFNTTAASNLDYLRGIASCMHSYYKN